MELVWPARQYLASYVAALETGWSSDNLRGKAAADEHLHKIGHDADAFLASLVDREARGGPITLSDGTKVARLPGYVRWLWAGEYCGSIGLRWQPGGETLPPYCLGHIGYSVVPWKQRRGYATAALAQTLPAARDEGLRYVEVTCDPANVGSRRVIEANGGVVVEEFVKLPAYGGTPCLRYRIDLREYRSLRS